MDGAARTSLPSRSAGTLASGGSRPECRGRATAAASHAPAPASARPRPSYPSPQTGGARRSETHAAAGLLTRQ